jgi:hypothetical protein
MTLPKKTGVILLLLLVAGMAIVPCVSAEEIARFKVLNQELIESNDIPVETAREQATMTMLSMTQSGALDENWSGAKINPAYEEIFDVNGERLFYQFSVERNGKRIGEIYAAASKVLGSPVITIGSINEPGSAEKLKEYTRNAVKEKFSGYQILSVKNVCFDYPFIGAMITVMNTKTGEEKTVIIDSRDGLEKNIDTQVSSYYNQIPPEEMQKRVAIWEQHNTAMEELKTVIHSENFRFPTKYSDRDVSRINEVITNAKTRDSTLKALLLKDGMRILSGLSHRTQYTDSWCGVATAQIISTKYMNPEWSQYHIADTMGAYYPDGTPKGTTPGMELIYYTASQGSGGLGKVSSYDIYRPFTTWEAARDEIENNRLPFKIGRDTPSYHARACNGWMVDGGNPYLLFYDPGVAGSIYWEYVAPGSTYNNFVYVR